MAKYIINRKSFSRDEDGTFNAWYAISYNGVTIGLHVLHVHAEDKVDGYWAITPSANVPGTQYAGSVDYFHVSMMLRHMESILQRRLYKSRKWERVTIWL